MSEYVDFKNNVYHITQISRVNEDEVEETKQRIMEELYSVFVH